MQSSLCFRLTIIIEKSGNDGLRFHSISWEYWLRVDSQISRSATPQSAFLACKLRSKMLPCSVTKRPDSRKGPYMRSCPPTRLISRSNGTTLDICLCAINCATLTSRRQSAFSINISGFPSSLTRSKGVTGKMLSRPVSCVYSVRYCSILPSTLVQY